MLSAWTLVRANGGTITACIRNSGLPRIVSDAGECRHKESPLSWNMQVEKGDKGDPGEAGTDGAAGKDGMELHLFDGAGQDLGILVSASPYSGPSTYTSYLPQLELLVHIESRTDERIDLSTIGQAIRFTESDCKGLAVVEDRIPKYTFTKYASKYYKDSGEAGAVRTMRSTAEQPDGCRNHDGFADITYGIDEVSLPFTEPVTYPPVVQTP